jgi:hypothetical protein
VVVVQKDFEFERAHVELAGLDLRAASHFACMISSAVIGGRVDIDKTIECDLDSADKMVGESAKEFLAALDGYERYDGQRIVEAFLPPFAERSEVTRGIQLEAKRSIKDFTSVCASLASDVNIAMM